MYKIVLLIDVKNSNFIVEKRNNNWFLPTLSNVENIDKIHERIMNKYNFDVKNIKLIIKEKNVLFVRCNLQSENFDKKKFKIEVLNEIASIINNKKQKELITNLLVRIGFEMLNDSFWLGIILTTEDNLKDMTLKVLLSDFLVFFSSIFCEELLTYKFGGIKNDLNITEKQIKKIRNSYLKSCPLFDSDKSKKIIDEMGIDLNSTIYDCVLFFVNKDLIDINFRTWQNREQEMYEILNGIVLSPRRWIKNCYPQFDSFFEEIRKSYVDYFIERFNKIEVEPKSYSTHKLFRNSKLSDNEKTYILQRIGLLKTTLLISKTFGHGNFISTKIESEFKLSFDNYLLKVKATIIEMIWNDYNQNKEKLLFLKDVLNNYPKDISEDFFKINRKCRDNIHYGYYHDITQGEIAILDKYQEMYISYVIKEFDKEIEFKCDLSYIIGLSLAKLQYWASH